MPLVVQCLVIGIAPSWQSASIRALGFGLLGQIRARMDTHWLGDGDIGQRRSTGRRSPANLLTGLICRSDG